eukprot:1493486-Ditylum_brightwellii.AAC.1
MEIDDGEKGMVKQQAPLPGDKAIQKGRASSFSIFIPSIQNSREVNGKASSFPPLPSVQDY